MRTNLAALPIHKNFVRLQMKLREARTPAIGRGIMDFPNKRMVSDDGTRALQWSASEDKDGQVNEVVLNPPIDVSKLNTDKARKPKKAKAAKANPKRSKSRKSSEPDIPLTEIFADPNRPQPPLPDTIPAGMAWVRRNLPAFIVQAMPEDIRPNGPGRIVTTKEAKLHGHGFWDIVFSSSPEPATQAT